MSNPSLVVYPVSDLEKAKRFFTAIMGAQPYADSPYYVGYRSGDVEVGLNPHAQGTEAIVYWTVSDIAHELAQLAQAGGETVQEPTDVSNGLLVALAKTPHGTIVGLRQMPK